MDKERFKTICQALRKPEAKGIGCLAEKRLHWVLKNYFEDNPLNQEVKVNGYIVDIKNERGIIEIQTQNFNKLREKLEALLPEHQLTIVYPIAQTKWIAWINPDTGEISKQRKSPKNGSIYDTFKELYKIKWFLPNDHLQIKILLIAIEEYRNLDGWSIDHKKGSTRKERYPLELFSEFTLATKADYFNILPDALPSPFTTTDFATITHISKRRAYEAINVFYYLNIINKIGKKRRNILYEKNTDSTLDK